MTNYWLIRAGRNGELWEQWREEEVITIGWDIGDVTEAQPSWNEMKEEIANKYPVNDPGGATGMVRRVAGLRDSDDENLKPGDIVVVEGNATVAGVAKVGEYRYEEEGLPENSGHTYWRDVEYLHAGPVRIRDLPQRFHQGSENSLHLPSTLKEYKTADEDVIESLLQAVDEAEEVERTQGFIDFSESSVQSYLESNLGEVVPSVDDFEREYTNAAGDADFVCESGDEIIVIETKVGTAKHDAVSQLMSYMNAIRSNQDRDVRGMIVAEDFAPKAKLAASSDDIELYSFEAVLDFQKIS